MVDSELVIRKLALITGDLSQLASIADKSLEDYLASSTDEVLAERYLERIIGRMIDINYHVITETGLPPPRDYYDSFTQLSKLKILAPAFASRIATCAGLRNRIVHEYDEIDSQKIHEALQAAVKDIPEYLRLIHQYVQALPR
ncbi:MAG: DUF86 domain-containing protein [Candidatus Rokubacteria bacterium]|nr:DUF86 domain-containing protein [Candidatus Rokubacteria bacterium]